MSNIRVSKSRSTWSIPAGNRRVPRTLLILASKHVGHLVSDDNMFNDQYEYELQTILQNPDECLEEKKLYYVKKKEKKGGRMRMSVDNRQPISRTHALSSLIQLQFADDLLRCDTRSARARSRSRQQTLHVRTCYALP